LGQDNKLRAAKPPVLMFAVSFHFHQNGGHSCENSKQSQSLGTSITVAESLHHFVHPVLNPCCTSSTHRPSLL
jgi:hypothetical protein